jgi:hypothetical protein
MLFDPSLVTPNPLLQPLASQISALIGIGRNAMGFKTHALPQMDRAVGAKLSVFLLYAHVSGRRPPDIFLDGLRNALLDISA